MAAPHVTCFAARRLNTVHIRNKLHREVQETFAQTENGQLLQLLRLDPKRTVSTDDKPPARLDHEPTPLCAPETVAPRRRPNEILERNKATFEASGSRLSLHSLHPLASRNSGLHLALTALCCPPVRRNLCHSIPKDLHKLRVSPKNMFRHLFAIQDTGNVQYLGVAQPLTGFPTLRTNRNICPFPALQSNRGPHPQS